MTSIKLEYDIIRIYYLGNLGVHVTDTIILHQNSIIFSSDLVSKCLFQKFEQIMCMYI